MEKILKEKDKHGLLWYTEQFVFIVIFDFSDGIAWKVFIFFVVHDCVEFETYYRLALSTELISRTIVMLTQFSIFHLLQRIWFIYYSDYIDWIDGQWTSI